ncbi:hypothetical protein TrispH2_009753 [Trichoplax sp. H2]|nr:hypothetical protein TrispH2_009753 [Trichoplax sp. H2]|eukprot:RDD37452.1 hypothetical protein TrispH2_009753 [Trichoplax sp. H2]
MAKPFNFLTLLDDIQCHLVNKQLDEANELIHLIHSKSTIEDVATPLLIISKAIQIAESQNQLLSTDVLYRLVRFAREIAVFSTNRHNLNTDQGDTKNIMNAVNTLIDTIHKFFKHLVKPNYSCTVDASPYLIFAELDIIYHLIQDAIDSKAGDNNPFNIRDLYHKAFKIVQEGLKVGRKPLEMLASELNTILWNHQSYKIYYIGMDIMCQIACCNQCSDYQRQIAYCGLEVNNDSGSATIIRAFSYFWEKFSESDNMLKTSSLQSNIIIQKWLNDTISLLQSPELPLTVQEKIKLDICRAADCDYPYIGYLLHHYRKQIKPFLRENVPIKLEKLLSAEEIENIQLSKFEINSSQSLLPVITNLPICEDLLPRDHYIHELHENLKRKHQCQITQASTIGMGGVGKSSVAILYAQQYQENYDLIRWFHAETEISLQYGMVILAKDIVDKGKNIDPIRYEKIARVRYWFNEYSKQHPEIFKTSDDGKMITVASESYNDKGGIIEKLVTATMEFIVSYCRYLLIYDNADSKDKVQRYLPKKTGNGHVVITSRHREWTDDIDYVEVEVFNREESTAYLLQRTKSDDKEAANAISELVGDLPLALAQVAACIRRTGLKLTGYLSKLKNEEQNLWKGKFGPSYYRKYIETSTGQVKLSEPLTHITTWTLTLSQLLEQHPIVEHIMILIGYIAADNIADSFLYEFCQQQDPNITKSDFDEGILALIDYNILHISDDSGECYDTHRIIQYAIQDYILKTVSAKVGHTSEDLTYPEDIVLSRILTYLTGVISVENYQDNVDIDKNKHLIMAVGHTDQFRKHVKTSQLLQYQLPYLEEQMLNLISKFSVVDKAEHITLESPIQIEGFQKCKIDN